jgi:CRISPR-associated protein Cas8a1/Csx13
VTDLVRFTRLRPGMTPQTARECRITSAGDAALQAQVRLRGLQEVVAHDLPGCHAITFRPTPWASKQKSRVATLYVPPGDERRLELFETALLLLPPRIVTNASAGNQDTHPEGFWADSVVRPLVADNLAQGRRWYAGFSRLMSAIDDNNRPIRNRLPFEQKGLHAMTHHEGIWDHQGEPILVRAVHTAIRNNFGRIRQETDGDRPLSQATKNRWNRFRERLRLSLVGAKTSDQCRGALCALFGNAGRIPELIEGWQAVLPLFADRDWQLARDLALLALASYAGREAEEETPEDTNASNS